MGHVVLGAPPVARYHLHERLLRALRQRGHRVSLLPLAPAEATFWRHQGEYLARLPANGARQTVANWPFDDLAPARRHGRRRRFADRAAALAAWLGAERPDLMVLHQRRDDDAALLHFAARAHGCRTLWFGDGLLPHTLQCDERGLDGDAAAATRRGDDFRVVRPDRELLAACLTHALAQAVVQNRLWSVEFGLTAFAPKFAANGDVHGVAGCLTRFAQALVLTLFCLNGVYLINDKTALAETEHFSLAPERFADRLRAILSDIGSTPAALSASLGKMQALFEDTRSLAGAMYTPTWRL
jgi:hypothetical protein